MSHFLNPKDSLLEDLINNGEYIDKSLLLDKLNSLIDNPCDKLLCVTSPKGFGKTLTLSLISSYYSKGNKTKKLFSSLEISKTKSWNKGINKFNVIKIDLLKEYENSLDKDNFIVHLTNELNKELQEAYPKVNIEKTKAVAHNLFNIFDKKKEKFIILIDNYDVLLRNDILEKERDAYLSFLNGLFKSSVSQNFIHLAYLTGTLPLPKDTIESRLNNFNEYSIIRLRDFAPFIGFKEDEVKLLCSKYDMEYDSCKDWYGGYCCDNGNCLFDPKDVMKGIKEKE